MVIARKRIGDMLIEAGLLTPEQLAAALDEQRRNSSKLGQAIVRKGYVREDDLVNLLSRQLNVSRYSPELFPLDVTLAALVPAKQAQKLQAVPIQRRPNLLMVAMTDPTDIKALDALETQTSLEVEPIICTDLEFGQLFSGLYGIAGLTSDMDGFLDDLGSLEFDAAEDEEAAQQLQTGSLRDMAEGAPVVRMVNWIISQAVRLRASDIHVSPERNFVQLRFRIDGRLREMPAPPKQMLLPVISRVKILAQMDIALSRIPQDGRFTFRIDSREVNVRASVVPTMHGENLVLRLLDPGTGVRSLEELGLAEDDRARLQAAASRPYGMLLCNGPTGSGKTTTLYAVLQKVSNPEINVMTLEDPVEYRLERIRQLQLNRKAGMTFASGLRSVLRQDPDVIMIGEIRDAETATIAVQAALTGHRVLSTLHTNDAVGAITRLVDMGIPPFLVGSVLILSVAQRLVRRVCPNCAKPLTVSPAVLEQWGLTGAQGEGLRHGSGCHQCMDTGFSGRVGLYEVLTVDAGVAEMISRQASTREITQAALERGLLTTLKADAARKVAQGLTTFEEAASAVML